MAWQRDGLTCPDAIRVATAEYRSAEDLLGSFLAERCVTGSPEYRNRSSDLYGAFKKWLEATGEKSMTQKAFGNALTDKGFERYTNNGTWYKGIALSNDGTTEGRKDF